MPAVGTTLNKKVLAAQSVDETTSTPVFALLYTNLRLLVEWGAGTNAGNVVLEAAESPTYAGPWLSIGAVAFSAASIVTSVAAVNACFPYVRVRIETAIGGGTIDAYLAGN
jgi:hypothetical protein